MAQDVADAAAGTAVTDRVWLSVDEAHQRTGVSKTELYTALQTGDLVGTQRGKNHKWRIHVEDLDTWMRGS